MLVVHKHGCLELNVISQTCVWPIAAATNDVHGDGESPRVSIVLLANTDTSNAKQVLRRHVSMPPECAEVIANEGHLFIK